MTRQPLIIGMLILGICHSRGQAAESLAEKYLLAGMLADGEKALQERLLKEPKDDQARFGLGVVQFFQAFEHLGNSPDRGINLRRVFTQPRTFDPVLWIQGTAATPYLEKGTLTKFADRRMLEQIDQAFGGRNFFGFAFWFN